MHQTNMTTLLAVIVASQALTQIATAAFSTTLYSNLSAWSNAVGGANECTWDFDPIGTPVWNGWGSFTNQYAGFGVRAPGTFYGSGPSGGATYPGLPYTQVGMSPETAWVLPSYLGLSSGIAVSGSLRLAFDAPVTGAAFHIVGQDSSYFQVYLSRNGVYLGTSTLTTLAAAPDYGVPQGGATISALVAFTADIEFDYIAIQTTWLGGGPWALETFWAPTTAIPAPSALMVLGVAAIGCRSRRRSCAQ